MSFHTHIEEACSACDDLYQELARLREALKEIDAGWESLGEVNGVEIVPWFAQIARNALKETT